MKRVYFSAYVPVGRHPTLPPPDVQAPLLREHRLYQADWLMRFYKFKVEEIVEQGENLDEDLDPKASWALRHLSFFPVEVNQADLALLLRVPGIGPISAKRIVVARRTRQLEHSDLKRRAALKRPTSHQALTGETRGARFFGPFSLELALAAVYTAGFCHAGKVLPASGRRVLCSGRGEVPHLGLEVDK